MVEYQKHSIESVDVLQPRHPSPVSIVMFHLYPGFHKQLIPLAVDQIGAKGIVLRSFGAGNGPDLRKEIEYAKQNGVVVVNCTECQKGTVVSTYKASDGLLVSLVTSLASSKLKFWDLSQNFSLELANEVTRPR